jgi:5-methylthioadenosine/S-adenosylhomocysteine deaminase
VLTCDPLDRGGRFHIVVRDGRIGEISENLPFLRSLYPGATIMDASHRLIIPGLVNAHAHMESFLFRTRTAGRHFELWKHDDELQELMERLIAPGSEDDVRTLTLAAYFAHLKSGTTCVAEFPPIVAARGFSVMREAIERTDVRAVVALRSWDQHASMANSPKGRIRYMLDIGDEDHFTVYTFESMERAMRELRLPVLAHVGEQLSGIDTLRRNFQKGPLALLRDYGILQPTTLLVHCNHIAAADLDVVAASGAAVALCARSAAEKRNGCPVLPLLNPREHRVCLGTDWGNMDMMEEIRFLRRLPQFFSGVFPYTAIELLRMATINGARALGLGNDIGSIETGKSADLVILSMADLRTPVVSQAASAGELAGLLVDHLTSKDISHVIIGGEVCVGNGALTTMAEEDVTGGFRRLHERWFSRAGRPEDRLPHSLRKEKILPFVGGGEAAKEAEGSYMEGFAARPDPPPPVIEPPRRPARPELPTTVRRVFGEDEDL